MTKIKEKLNLNEKKIFTLADLKKGQSATIHKVSVHSLFAPLGIREGKKIQLDSIHPFSGPLLLRIDNRQIAISQHLASGIELKLT